MSTSRDVELSQFDPNNLTADLVEEHIDALSVIDGNLSTSTNLNNTFTIGRYREPFLLGIQSISTDGNTVTQNTTDGQERVFSDIKLGGQVWQPSISGEGILVAADNDNLVYDNIFSDSFQVTEEAGEVSIADIVSQVGEEELRDDRYASFISSSQSANNVVGTGNNTFLPLNSVEVNNMLEHCWLANGYVELGLGTYFLKATIVMRGGLAWRLRNDTPDTEKHAIDTRAFVTGYSNSSAGSQRTSKLARPYSLFTVTEAGARFTLMRDGGTATFVYGGGFDGVATPPLDDRWLHNVHFRLEVWKIG